MRVRDDQKGPWHEVVDGTASRLEAASAFGFSITFNAEGSAALAKMMRKMALVLDAHVKSHPSDYGANDEKQR